MLKYFVQQKNIPMIKTALELVNSDKLLFWSGDFSAPYKNIDKMEILCAEINKMSIEINNEHLANAQYVALQYYKLFCNISDYYLLIQEKRYKDSWNKLQDCIDIALIIGRFSDPAHRYEIPQILAMLHAYESFYPYKYFASIECIVSEAKCSICDKSTLNLDCPHIAGNLYWGEMAISIILKAKEVQAVAIVESPLDKRCILEPSNDKRPDNVKFQHLVEAFNTIRPFSSVEVEVQKSWRVKPHLNIVDRNAPCPCESGKKFKKCCGKELHYRHEHHVVTVLEQIPCITL